MHRFDIEAENSESGKKRIKLKTVLKVLFTIVGIITLAAVVSVVLYLVIEHLNRPNEVCCPGLERCFTREAPFFFFPLPQCPESMAISMKVYTRQNRSDGQELTRNNTPSVFNATLMSIFIVHGWLENEDYPWMHAMKDAFLNQSDYNIIIVGWRKGAGQINYLQSASNTQTVGAEIALRSNFTISNRGSSRSLQYCIGHSLGAHVCGNAGKQGQFDRVTGLDPAGPMCTHSSNWTCGLSPSSADFVDVIHTNGENGSIFALGTLKQLGHVDFYPNGGVEQPGCFPLLTATSYSLGFAWNLSKHLKNEGFKLTVGCSHIFAILFYTESIRKPCFKTNITCILEYQYFPFPDLCMPSQNVVQSMGFYANRSIHAGRGQFYLNTSDESAFCLS